MPRSSDCTSSWRRSRHRPVPELMGDAQLDSLIRQVSNWDRWGPEDERGTVNLITPERRLSGRRNRWLGLRRSTGTTSPLWLSTTGASKRSPPAIPRTGSRCTRWRSCTWAVAGRELQPRGARRGLRRRRRVRVPVYGTAAASDRSGGRARPPGRDQVSRLQAGSPTARGS